MSNVTILNTSIRQYGNLFSLNDLHIASGGENKHAPFRFVRIDTTQELIAEMKNEDPQAEILLVKNGIGTYACEELVLAYAMWISPKFHLVVLRAFLAMHKGETQPQQMALPEPQPDITLSHQDAEHIAQYLVRARAFAKEVEVHQRELFALLGVARYQRNDLAAKGYDLAHEFNSWIDPFINEVLPQTKFVRLPRR